MTCTLTPREKEILDHLTTGKRYKEIADLLYIEHGTVKTHVEHIINSCQETPCLQAGVSDYQAERREQDAGDRVGGQAGASIGAASRQI